MTIHLDHIIVPSRNQAASAKLLAELLGVPWAETGAGPFSPVYVNDGLTLDFQETDSRRLESSIEARCGDPWICGSTRNMETSTGTSPTGTSGSF